MIHPKEGTMAIQVKMWYLVGSNYLMITPMFWGQFAPMAKGLPKYLGNKKGIVKIIGFCLIFVEVS